MHKLSFPGMLAIHSPPAHPRHPQGPVGQKPRSTQELLAAMEAIKKKMQAMKVEKDNACDRVDVCEEQCKAARVSSWYINFSIENSP